MTRILSPLKRKMRGAQVAMLQDALGQLIERGVLPLDEHDSRAIVERLHEERRETVFREATFVLVQLLQRLFDLEATGEVDRATAELLDRLLEKHGIAPGGAHDQASWPPGPHFVVQGVVRLADGSPARGLVVSAYDADLRREEPLGHAVLGRKGGYRIAYHREQFARAERDGADLVVRVRDARGSELAVSTVLFNAPAHAQIDLAIPFAKLAPPALIEKIADALQPLLRDLPANQLEENDDHRDLTFLGGETGIETAQLARFALACRLADKALPREAWFAFLRSSTYDEKKGIAEQTPDAKSAVAALDADGARKTLTDAFAANDLDQALAKNGDAWLAARAAMGAKAALGSAKSPTFAAQALKSAGIAQSDKQTVFAQIVGDSRKLTPQALDALAKSGAFSTDEIADLQTSYHLADITGGDFSVVGAIKQAFDLAKPDQLAALARNSGDEWTAFVAKAVDSGAMTPPLAMPALQEQAPVSSAVVYGTLLRERFAAAYPTAAFGGDLSRALTGSAVKGIPAAPTLKSFLDAHADFDLLRTPVDAYLDKAARPQFRDAEDLASNLKAVQRVAKVVPSYQAADTLMADGVHSAQGIYRRGRAEFVQAYGDKPGFTPQTAALTWNRAADTYAAVVTWVGDLQALRAEGMPAALINDAADDALSTFPNWNNLFHTGDLCSCDECNSVLGPAAYFADLLQYARGLQSAQAGITVGDILLGRRPDLGYLELNCDNALTPLPYVDVVCEVLESVISNGASDVRMVGFNAINANPVQAKADVAAQFQILNIDLGADFTLNAVGAADPGAWVVHGEAITYRLKPKSAGGDFYARILPNTKAGADELRAYPAYVDENAYETLRETGYPFTLPFDLFGEETRAGFQKCNLARWDLMKTFHGNLGPSDVEIACEYFSISCDASAPIDEKSYILDARASDGQQQTIWGEGGHADWKTRLANVKTFLFKTGLEYEPMLALFDLPFIKGGAAITIDTAGVSCDLADRTIVGLDAGVLDRIHRFLRLSRKLPDWKVWELDLAIRAARIGGGALDGSNFLVNLFWLHRIQTRFGAKATVEQVLALFGPLNTETHYTESYKPRADGLYQGLFLNKRLIRPIDPAFAVAAVSVAPPATEQISGHLPVVLAALGVSQSDVATFQGVTRPGTANPYINDDLVLSYLSYLWRQAFLSRQFKRKSADWALILTMLGPQITSATDPAPQKPFEFKDPKSAFDFLGLVDQVALCGLTPDQLDWVLGADPLAKAATKESAAARTLLGLRKDLQALTAQYDPSAFPALDPGTDPVALADTLTSLLQLLGRDDAAAKFFIDTLSDAAVVTLDVPGLPGAFTDFPAVITAAIPISYNATDLTITFTGLMTTAQQTILLNDASLANVTGNANYQAAIAELFRRPRSAIRFYEPVFSAPLAVLPAGVDFNNLSDPALVKKISFDAENGLLVANGILTPADKAALDLLSADPLYRNAVNSVFTQPTSLAPPIPTWLEDADLLFPLRDPNPANDHLAFNLKTAILEALPYLTATLSKKAAIGELAAALGLTDAFAAYVMTNYAVLPGPQDLLDYFTGPFAASLGAMDSTSLPVAFQVYCWAQRSALLLKQWAVTLPDWKRIVAITANAKLLDLATLPLTPPAVAPADRFLRTCRLLRLRASLPETSTTLLEVLQTLNAGGYANAAAFADDVERLDPDWQSTDVQGLIGQFDLAYSADYLLAENWDRLRRAFYFLTSLNCGASAAAAFGAVTMNKASAEALKNLLRSKFGTESFLTLSRDIQDALRERKRDALSSYLLAQSMPADAPSGKWDDTNDLYAYYLLDVEMCSCLQTSRLVQGSGSIQLFIQRCLMGLEPKITVNASGASGDSAWNWWTWMSQYRVWQANREVFLWPENWIAPELKPDRSSFMKDLESELKQNDVNSDSTTTAFTNYLSKLDDVAQLEIAGFYQDENGDDILLHVFGRTRGAEPHIYYHRTFDYRLWSAWEKVDLDIQGDYLTPAVVGGKLFLFWPIFTEVPDAARNSTIPLPDTTSTSPAKVQKAWKQLRVQLAVSDYRQGKWTPKRVSKDCIESQNAYDANIVRQRYRVVALDSSDVDGRFGVQISGNSIDEYGKDTAYLSGTFDIAGCKGLPELSDGSFGSYTPILRAEHASVGNDTFYMRWQELKLSERTDNDRDFSLEARGAGYSPYGAPIELLKDTAWPFQMTPPWHLSYLDKLALDGNMVYHHSDYLPNGMWLPWFYNDRSRTFFVLPALWGGLSVGDGKLANIWRYYPDVKTFVESQENAIAKVVRKSVNNFDLGLWDAATRAAAEAGLFSQFQNEHAPPYTDVEVRDLLVRFVMRYAHVFLALEAGLLFMFRQFEFHNFYHPFVCSFAKIVYDPLQGVPGLMRRDVQLQDSGFDFKQFFQPTGWVVDPTTADHYPKEVVDFSPDGAYSPYNWELFFHIPLLIANTLSANQQFSQARDWYHYIFNPLGVEAPGGGSAMSKYWITKPFFETTDNDYLKQRIENILAMLAGDASAAGYSTTARDALIKQVKDWRDHPFEPHRIAAYRTVAYQKTAVMRYLDNLIAWGDNLFEQDTMESINQATQLYIMAAEILGPRPKKVPAQVRPPLETYYELEADKIDAFSNALVQVENLVPPMNGNGGGMNAAPLPMLYFCIPYNTQMVGYWDKVADRLYKIRHCMNIEGEVQQLALFAPPIDPGALVKAVAGGLDLSSALADLAAPLPLYRFNVLLQKANEVCGDVRALGAALLGALEKKDAEGMALLRQSQELQVLNAVLAVKRQQLDEANENLEAVKKSKIVTTAKRDYYQNIQRITDKEQQYLDKLSASHQKAEAAQGLKLSASIISIIPAIDLGASGFGGSPIAKFKLGGLELGQAAGLAADVLSFLSQIDQNDATMASIIGGYDRRWNDWKFQEDMANKELAQIDLQIAAAELRGAIAQKEIDNQNLQIDNSKAVDAYMRSKYTNQDLYQWQVAQISGVYFSSYKLAYDLAKRAERCFRFELGLQDSSYVNFGYWDSLKKGLLSGENLQYDLRRLETAYIDKNKRELELTKHVSLALHDPRALARMVETGQCFFDLPEEIFDLDYPGHYFRRLKSVSFTMPCVAGPYTTISCTARLVKNSIRISSTAGDQYARNADEHGPADDPRFIESAIPVKAIATSGGQNDAGLFELSFRDERYLPFEGAGAISGWSLELISDPQSADFGAALRQFDYRTISDVILHLKYTAREDAGPFKTAAMAHLRSWLGDADSQPLWRAFNLRRDFPSQWARFLNPTDPAGDNVFELDMSANLFRALDRGQTLKLNAIYLLARCMDAGSYKAVLSPPLTAPKNSALMPVSSDYGALHVGILPADPADPFDVQIPPNGAPVTWKLTVTRPGGGKLQIDPATGEKEIADFAVILGYERV